jgi:hypothetical protein
VGKRERCGDRVEMETDAGSEGSGGVVKGGS